MTPIHPTAGTTVQRAAVTTRGTRIDSDGPPRETRTAGSRGANAAPTTYEYEPGTAPAEDSAPAGYEYEPRPAPVSDQYESDTIDDAYAADRYTAVASPVAGGQPAISEAPTATMDDFAALGLYTQEELVQLYEMQLPPHEMGILYEESVAYMQSPQFEADMAAMQEQAAAGVPAADTAAMDPAAAEAAAATQQPQGPPAWNDEWADRFREAFKEQGLSSKTRMAIIQSLEQLPLDEAQLEQTFQYYTTDPAGLEELQVAEKQVAKGEQLQQGMMLAPAVLAGAGGLGIAALSRSEGNLRRALTRVAANGSDDAARVANRALSKIGTDALGRGTSLGDDVSRVLAEEARNTRRLFHPFRKMSLNAASRHVSTPTHLTSAQKMKYALMMNGSDDVGRATANAGRAAASVSDDVGRVAGSAGRAAVTSGADDALRATSGLARAGSGISKALGPIGLAVGAGFGIWEVKKTMEAEGEYGEESKKATGRAVGGLAGGAAGAAIGASVLAPTVVGAPVGAIVGGIIGSTLGSLAGETLGGLFG